VALILCVIGLLWFAAVQRSWRGMGVSPATPDAPVAGAGARSGAGAPTRPPSRRPPAGSARAKARRSR
jgi:hypothetical protein